MVDSAGRVLMRMNILLLMAVSFLPFPTRLMAEGLAESTAAERAAVIVYGIAMLVGVLLLPEIAAFAFLAVAARSIFVAEGEVRLTFAPLRGDR